MDRMIFLNVGWMSGYSGPDEISGGGKFVAAHGWGHEMLNFKPFAGKMYGTAATPRYGDIKLERLGAAKGEKVIDGVLVVWVAKSHIVGWYKNASVYRHSKDSPKNSGRSHRGHPIDYRVTAPRSDCTLLNPDDRHFSVPRAQEREQAMGRYIWYAEGKSNRAFRAKVLKYVAAGGDISVVGGKGPKRRGGIRHQQDPYNKAKIEHSAIDLATQHYKRPGYSVDYVGRDNLGWDLNAVHQQTGLRLRIEVKGVSGQEISIELTPNEYKMLRKHKPTYRLCVGTNCLKKSQRRLAIFAYNDTSHRWVDGNDRPLQVNEVKSARLRLLN